MTVPLGKCLRDWEHTGGSSSGILRDDRAHYWTLAGITRTDWLGGTNHTGCHLIAAQHLDDLLAFSVRRRQSWAAIIDAEKARSPFPSIPSGRHGQGPGRLAAPAQAVECWIRDTEHQQRGERSRRAVTVAPMCQWQSPGPSWHTRGGSRVLPGLRRGRLLSMFQLSSRPVLSCFLTLFFCSPGDSVGFLATFLWMFAVSKLVPVSFCYLKTDDPDC